VEEAITLYDRIGVGYDGTRRADPGIAARLAALLDLRGGPACLDAACGTGNYTQALALLGGRWTGVDVAPRMIAEARSKASGRFEVVRRASEGSDGDYAFVIADA
jgi:ubiquinone/menaquinone biosynthesis C-methylase UbiE